MIWIPTWCLVIGTGDLHDTNAFLVFSAYKGAYKVLCACKALGLDAYLVLGACKI